ncbi:MAG: large conductance mechanosensitive channel protein MscL [Bacteroidota bacterium]|nr:large conductance mechanosensitive channel protein MscL [Bacteroidota bacterium]
MLKEFKDFALKGNAMELAIGVIIGAAFGKIVSSLVEDVLMPFIAIFTGGVSFKELYFATDGKHYESLAKAKEAGANIISYGNFIQSILDFTIIAFCIFLIVKLIITHKKKEETSAVASISTTDALLTEIRDSLKNK